eukprot:1640177-Pleurochrysis_carterae.AAC.2
MCELLGACGAVRACSAQSGILCTLVVFVLLVFVAQPVLILMRIDEVIHVTWFVILIPIWLVRAPCSTPS